jgi:SAM-dependent methyltransferase
MSRAPEDPPAVPLSRQYAKLCELRDFNDPALIAAIRSLVPERDPHAHVERKVWEFAMVMLFLEEMGYLDERSQVLSVGAGDERILFWLTTRIGRMVATDIYGEGSFADGEAQASMLEDPAAHAPAYDWRGDRLDVRKMDARKLEFPDASFDAVFTVSSIEHFGSPSDIARAAAEIGRVLRPGGHAVIITECLLRRHPLNSAPVDLAVRIGTVGRRRRLATFRRRSVLGEVFTPRELERRIVRPSGLTMMQPLSLDVSADSWNNVTTIDPSGQLSSRTGDLYPMILLRVDRSVFTSACLVLTKPATERPQEIAGAD